MQITWVNHASFIADCGEVRLITDPWLDGPAFANGWGLLSPSQFTPAGFENITHIWISHEHPDHFSTATLRSIAPDVRSRITVLLQPTRDRKVLKYCQNLGFRDVVELPAGAWVALVPDVEVMCQPEKMDDSWLAIRHDGSTVLNLNDCLIASETELDAVLEQLGTDVDVLFTQFSFAAWIGNPEDEAAHQEMAREALDRITLQTQVIQPKWVVPCASFVWFCHEENFHMNQWMNRIGMVVDHLSNETPSRPIVLYPGDEWLPGESDPTESAVARYDADYESLPQRPLFQGKQYDLDVLPQKAEAWRDQLKRHHGITLAIMNRLGRVPPTSIWLTDHRKAVMLSLGGIAATTSGAAGCDIAMSSEALVGCLEGMWGGMTLIINGRFQTRFGSSYLESGGPPPAFRRYVALADDANHGWTIGNEIRFRLMRLLPWAEKRDWLARRVPQREA